MRIITASLTALAVITLNNLSVLAVPKSVDPDALKLAPPFSDHMVLQREMPVPIWGTAKPGETITVTFAPSTGSTGSPQAGSRLREDATAGTAGQAAQTKTVTVAEDGKWLVKLDPLKASAEGRTLSIQVSGVSVPVSGVGKPETRNLLARSSLGEGGKPDTISISDVLVGEVWVGAGQSNMEIPDYSQTDYEALKKTWGDLQPEGLQAFKQAREAALAVEADEIRLVDMRGGHKPTWEPWVGPKKFTGELAYFGLRLHQELKVPIGLVQTAKGGSAAAVWVTPEMLADCPEYVANTYVSPDKRVTAPEKIGSEYRQRFENRVVPYAIRGVYWDQGESAAQLPSQNIALTLMALIKGWRKAWGQGDFWFLYTEKTGSELESAGGCGCAYDVMNPVTAAGGALTALPKAPNSKVGEARRYMRIRRMLPNVDMVITADLGGNVHPYNKYGHGQRAAALALGKVYGKSGEYFGPVYAKHVVEGSTVRVSFEHVGQGLVFKTNDTVKALQGFALAGEDKVFHWASATVDGDAVVLTCPAVPKPVAVRYAWEGRFSWANLFNKDGYPALGFRTDDWN